MPKLHPMNSANAENLLKDLDGTRMSLFNAMQRLNRHYRKDHRLVKRASSFYEMFADFIKDCEREVGAKVQK